MGSRKMLGPKLLFLIALSLQAWDVSAGNSLHRLTKPDHLAHIAGCYSSHKGKVHPFGSTVYPKGVCRKLVCRKNGYTEVHTCDKKEVPEDCYLSQVSHQPYPHCCPEVICDVTNDSDDNSEDPSEDDAGVYVDPYYNADRPAPMEYYELDYDQPRLRRSVEYYDFNNRGDDYKLDETATNDYDVKDVSSRRSPWNKNKSV